MTLAVLTTLGTVLGGVLALWLIPFLARRGSAARAVLYGLIGAVFCFSFARWIVGLAGAAMFGLPHQGAMLLTGGLPVRGIDVALFVAFLILAALLTRGRRRVS
ncbi:hypothetical protein [Oceaniglobus indicus]|uniref:hypothetical protein n=1 Tax=Oceaniglobus indicus TaxID=2047749 RepID=UPI000C17CC85|nr:hypothetical protein [Oceaniglobus indicus]